MGFIFLSLGKKLNIAVFRRDSFSATNDMASVKNASSTMSLLRLGLSFLLSFWDAICVYMSFIFFFCCLVIACCVVQEHVGVLLAARIRRREVRHSILCPCITSNLSKLFTVWKLSQCEFNLVLFSMQMFVVKCVNTVKLLNQGCGENSVLKNFNTEKKNKKTKKARQINWPSNTFGVASLTTTFSICTWIRFWQLSWLCLLYIW